ncbi:hypothetical protein D3C75_663000 [compost metagenome]
MEHEEDHVEVVIQESPGGHWNIWSDGCKIDDGPFRRAGDAQEFCNANGWTVTAVLKHEPERPQKHANHKPRDGLYYDPPSQ